MSTNNLINGCIKVEKSAASIYKNLMKKFPEKKEFWKNLFDDEVEHASFFKDLKNLGLIDTLQRMDSTPSISIINKTLKSADNIIDKIKGGTLSFNNALKITLKFEESMVEIYTNKVIANLLSCEDKPSHKKLIADERKHMNKIKKMIKLQSLN
jgi:rubrerythrin